MNVVSGGVGLARVVVVVAKPSLDAKTVTKLTDAAQTLFLTLFELEQRYKVAAKRNLQRRPALLDLDVFRNDTEHEEPDEWQ